MKKLEELTDTELLDLVAHHNIGTIQLLGLLRESRELNKVLQDEVMRRVRRAQNMPQEVKDELERIFERIDGQPR